MTQEEIKDIALCGETSTVQFKVTVWRTLQKNDDTHLEILSGKITDNGRLHSQDYRYLYVHPAAPSLNGGRYSSPYRTQQGECKEISASSHIH